MRNARLSPPLWGVRDSGVCLEILYSLLKSQPNNSVARVGSVLCRADKMQVRAPVLIDVVGTRLRNLEVVQKFFGVS